MARLDKTRPVFVLTRDAVQLFLNYVQVAPITTTIRGLSTEIPVAPINGLESGCVVSCDNITTVLKEALGRQLGILLAEQNSALTEAILVAFDLEEAF